MTNREEPPAQISDLDNVIQKEFVEVSDHGSYEVNENNASNGY